MAGNVPAIAGTFSYFERSHDMENAIGPTPGREPDETTRMWLDTLYQLLNGWLSVNAVDVPLLLSQLCTLPPRFQERNRAAVARSLRARLRDNGYQLGTTQLSVLQQLIQNNFLRTHSCVAPSWEKSEEDTPELPAHNDIVCPLLLSKKKN